VPSTAVAHAGEATLKGGPHSLTEMEKTLAVRDPVSIVCASFLSSVPLKDIGLVFNIFLCFCPII
jgi:hypothetical protein